MKTLELENNHSVATVDLRRIHTWWRAANYLSVGQIYLLDNPLLAVPLKAEHIKPRLLGHWGTTPGLNFLYAHLNRVINCRNLNVLPVIGSGHGGPALVANAWLEGSYSELCPELTRDANGMKRLFRQFSFPGGIPSHCAPDVPGSIHEGGELGYSLAHAFGAAFDNPELVVACVVGDGEAETGPLATAWHSNKFLNPCTNGTVLPILHLNGYKSPIQRFWREFLVRSWRACSWDTAGSRTSCPARSLGRCTPRWPRPWIAYLTKLPTFAIGLRTSTDLARPRWPMIVLESPKGWTGPKTVDGVPVEGTWRAHQVPLAEVRSNPAHLRQLEEWMRSYGPDELFGSDGVPRTYLLELAPAGSRRMGMSPMQTAVPTCRR